MSRSIKNDLMCFYNKDVVPTIDNIKIDCPLFATNLDTIKFYLGNLLVTEVITPHDYKHVKKIIMDLFTNTRKEYTSIRLIINNREVLNLEFAHLRKCLQAIFKYLDEKYITPYTKKCSNNQAEV